MCLLQGILRARRYAFKLQARMVEQLLIMMTLDLMKRSRKAANKVLKAQN